MNATEFINKCDSVGGVEYIFELGVTPYQIEDSAPKEFRDNLVSAYEHWKRFKDCVDMYYDMCENCEHEE